MKSPSEWFFPEDVRKMEEDLRRLESKYGRLLLKAASVVHAFKTPKAQEYMLHGVCRRLKVVARCVSNIYSIFPLSRNTLLSQEELSDVAINLHAFFVNVFGLLDNLAWVLVFENAKDESFHRKEVTIFNEKVKKIAPITFRDYLDSGHIKKWHDDYLKDYRDTLAHRIAPYLPPKTITPDQRQSAEVIQEEFGKQLQERNFTMANKLQSEDDAIGEPCPLFLHAIEDSRAVYLHPQILADFSTIEEIVEKFCFGFEK